MLCMKCGKETAEKQVFCQDCLAVMESCPIKPGTAVHLPIRNTPSQEKKLTTSRRDPTPTDHLNQLRRLIHWMLAAIAVLSVLLLITAGMLIHTLEKEPLPRAIGRNYTTAAPGNQP